MGNIWKKSTILTVFFVLLIGIISFYSLSSSSYSDAKSQAIHIAKNKVGIQKNNYYSEFNRNHQYFTVGGYLHNTNNYRYVIINKSGKINLLNGNPNQPYEAEKITLANRKVKKILHVSLGYYKNKPVWETAYLNKDNSLGYTLTNFKNSKIIQIIDNL